jgi:hypothetical protein
VTGPAPARCYLRIGKTVTQGEWNANLQHIGLDLAGADAPAEDRPKRRAAPPAAP